MKFIENYEFNMWKIEYTQKSVEDFEKLEKIHQKRIKNKLDFYIATWHPVSFAKKLTNPDIWEYRYRIWDYRIIFDVDENWKIIIIALIWKRWEIYKNI